MDHDLRGQQQARDLKNARVVGQYRTARGVCPELESFALEGDLDRGIWPPRVLEVDGDRLSIEPLNGDVVRGHHWTGRDEAGVNAEGEGVSRSTPQVE